MAAADEILRHLDELGVTAPRLLRGEQQACWLLLAHAGTLGLPSRIGLEDTSAAGSVSSRMLAVNVSKSASLAESRSDPRALSR